ncbi:MAG: hypothetical protein M3N97_06965 [Pseudomonadota bacterium]|nr:hypothetical protein [Pseudomonadota bacterium]
MTNSTQLAGIEGFRKSPMGTGIFCGGQVGACYHVARSMPRDIEVPAARDGQDPHRGEVLDVGLNDTHATDYGHDHIRDDEVGGDAPQFGDGIHRIVDGANGKTCSLEHAFNAIAHVGFVVDDQYAAENRWRPAPTTARKSTDVRWASPIPRLNVRRMGCDNRLLRK